MTVAITGATGFVGRHLVEACVQEGHRVIGAVRNPDKLPSLADDDAVELRRCDLLDRASLVSAFQGADVVVANAALVSYAGDAWETLERTNVLGTENVLRAAHEAGVERVVYVSSTAVYRDRRGKLLYEDSPKLGREDLTRFNRYQVSKALAEGRAWELADELSLAMTALRPGPIFGPGDTQVTPLLRRVFSLPVVILPTFLRVPLVYVRDFATSVTSTLTNHASIGEAFNTTDDSGSTVRDVYDAWKRAGGPSAMLAVGAPLPGGFRVDCEKAYNVLGWRARPLEDGFRETLEEMSDA